MTTTPPRTPHSGYALASDSINVHGLSPFIDRVRIRITSSDPSRPLFAGIAPTGDVERYLGDVSYTTVNGHDVTDHPGTGVPAAPAAALPWAARAQGTGTLTLTWVVQDGDWTVVVMNADARPGLSVRAEAGISVPALALLAGELLAVGAADRRGGGCPDRRAGAAGLAPVGDRPAQVTYSCPFGPSAIPSFFSPAVAGPTSTAPVPALNCEP